MVYLDLNYLTLVGFFEFVGPVILMRLSFCCVKEVWYIFSAGLVLTHIDNDAIHHRNRFRNHGSRSLSVVGLSSGVNEA